MTASAEFLRDPITSIDLPDAPTCAPQTPVAAVIRQLREARRGAALVVAADGALQGIFTERDAVMKVFDEAQAAKQPVSKFMTAKVVTLEARKSLCEAVRVMTSRGIRHLPVVESEGTAKKVLSIRNVVDFVVEHYPEEVYNLPPVSDFEQYDQVGA